MENDNKQANSYKIETIDRKNRFKSNNANEWIGYNYFNTFYQQRKNRYLEKFLYGLKHKSICN